MKPRGIFITFEGGEGAGKTTHIKFLASSLRSMGYDVLLLREPGGTAMGEKIRNLLLDTGNADISDRTELLLYEAARAQLVHEVIEPALEAGKIVICDRFFDSTTAYQGYGRELPIGFVTHANLFACAGIEPDRTILLTTEADAATGIRRATHHTEPDRIESAGLAFHERVNDGFLQLAKETDRIRVVSSASDKPTTAAKVFSQVADLFGWDDFESQFDQAFFKRILQQKSNRKASVVQGV